MYIAYSTRWLYKFVKRISSTSARYCQAVMRISIYTALNHSAAGQNLLNKTAVF